ncbi:MAG: tRNA (adenosine(37)-N6)-dimethylallyltransferase MiaA [Bacteroidales bacterium]|nr:tRNA (adenosine(37)-N6)-dimethylallyltransferase MiaA [Candidatus Cacconaster caballi]
MNNYELICILGPTASGKTRYAVETARRIGGEIISADSRQVYRGMDIGTGKDLSEYGEVPYHLIDIADAGTKYNIYQYQKDFEEAFRDIVARGRWPILCGGSGLYIEAATCGYYLPDVPADEALRAELGKLPTEELMARYEALRKPHNKTDYDTRQRLIRALEIAIYEESHPVNRTSFLPKKTKYIGIDVSREERNRRIDARLEARLKEGLVEEVRSLLDSGLSADDLIYYGLEYKFVTLYLTGVLTYEEMVLRLGTAIHQFAKRQMTWFRGMERRGIQIEWITFDNGSSRIW